MSRPHLQETNFMLQWYVPYRVLYSIVQGSLCDKDSEYADEMLTHSLNQASDTVHLLMDVTRVRKPASTRLHLQHHILNHMNIGWIATVGMMKNSVLNFGISALSPKTRIHHRDCASMQEALAFLQEVDTTLPDLSDYEFVS